MASNKFERLEQLNVGIIGVDHDGKATLASAIANVRSQHGDVDMEADVLRFDEWCDRKEEEAQHTRFMRLVMANIERDLRNETIVPNAQGSSGATSAEETGQYGASEIVNLQQRNMRNG